MPAIALPLDLEWLSAAPALGAGARMAAAVAVGGLPLAAEVPVRVRAALALALALVAAPTAVAAAPIDVPLPLLLLGEAALGAALGAAAAAAFAAAGWAGTILASVAGLSWADDFAPGGDAQGAGLGRLAWWVGLAGFFSAGGHLAVIAGLVGSVARIPIGTAFAGGAASAAALVAAPAAALELALALAAPALVAVVVFHVAAAVCLRAIRFTPGQGMLQTAAALVALVAVFAGSATWATGSGAAATALVDRHLPAGQGAR